MDNPSPKPDPTDQDRMLYITGIISISTLMEIVDNIVLIRKAVNFGSVFLDVEKGEIKWVGVKMKKRARGS